MQLKLVLLFSAVALFAGINSEEEDLSVQYRRWVVDRSASSPNSPGYMRDLELKILFTIFHFFTHFVYYFFFFFWFYRYYILPVDKTAFRVSQVVYLYQFDVPKIYIYDPVTDQIPTQDVNVRVRLIEYSKAEGHEQVLYNEQIILNSKRDGKFRVSNVNGRPIVLKPQYLYHFQLDLPENVQLMYSDVLELKEYSHLVSGNNYIRMKFYQHNTIAKPPGITGDRRLQSLGLVKRLHLKYSVVWNKSHLEKPGKREKNAMIYRKRDFLYVLLIKYQPNKYLFWANLFRVFIQKYVI